MSLGLCVSWRVRVLVVRGSWCVWLLVCLCLLVCGFMVFRAYGCVCVSVLFVILGVCVSCAGVCFLVCVCRWCPCVLVCVCFLVVRVAW